MQQETIETSMAKDWFFLFKEKKHKKKNIHWKPVLETLPTFNRPMRHNH